MLDDISQAVLAREDVVRYLRGGYGDSGAQARERINALPRRAAHDAAPQDLPRAAASALSDPPQDRAHAREPAPRHATRSARHRIVYVSNHKSHTDYLVEPLVLDDNGIRPPLIAAGINLFGGPLGLIHQHVTGAIPIRRNTKDPAYLITLKAYVAEILKKHDLFFYPEGGRSYSGELKPRRPGCSRGAERRAAQPRDHPGRRRLRPGARGSHPGAPAREEAAAPVRAASWPRWCATRSATGRARSSPSARRFRRRPRRPLAQRRARAGAPDPRTHRRALQGAADRGVRRRDAAVDHAPRSRSRESIG